LAAEKPQNVQSAPQALKRDLIFKGLAARLKAVPFQPSIPPEFFPNLIVGKCELPSATSAMCFRDLGV